MSQKPVLVELFRVAAPVGILLAGVVGFAAISQKPPPATRAEPEALPQLVTTVPVEPHAARLDLQADGLVIPHREIAVSAEVAGRITFKSDTCRTGRIVRQGELLFEIDPQTYELETKRLAAELAQAEASLHELDVELENAQRLVKVAEQQLALQQRNSERVEGLSVRGASTQSALDEAQKSELAANNSLVTVTNQTELISAKRETQAQLRDIAEVKLHQAQLDLARTRVMAPLNGVVVADDVEEDQFVAVGNPLVRLEDTSAVEVRCNLRMDQLQWILRQPRASDDATSCDEPCLPQTPVTCRYQLGDQIYSWSGMLVSYDGSGIDERTRTVPVRVLVEHPRERRGGSGALPGLPGLVRGMYVQVSIHAEVDHSLLTIPDAAVHPGPVVWRVREGELQILPVTVAQADRESALVDGTASGLLAGDLLVVSPLTSPVEGMPVREEAAQ
ncbi:MAG: efflux RND transporter periplasmic adaptor subunit [Planctomycetaceae bacterium]